MQLECNVPFFLSELPSLCYDNYELTTHILKEVLVLFIITSVLRLLIIKNTWQITYRWFANDPVLSESTFNNSC